MKRLLQPFDFVLKIGKYVTCASKVRLAIKFSLNLDIDAWMIVKFVYIWDLMQESCCKVDV